MTMPEMQPKKQTLREKIALLKNSPLLILFCFILFGLFFFNLATPDKAVSEMENKSLTQMPTINFEKVTTANLASTLNTYFSNYTDYAKDQIAGRDALISAYSFVETAVFQKTDIGQIYLGDDDMMFTKTVDMLTSEETNYPANIAALAALSEAYPGMVSAIIAPTSAQIYTENIPDNAPMLDMNAMIDEVIAAGEAAGANMIDVRDTLTAHKDEYIYYRTDHHWTTLGAYYAYEAYCESLQLEPFDTSAYNAVEISDFYGTHYAKARTWDAVPDTLTYYEMDNQLTVYKVYGTNNIEVDTVSDIYLYENFDAYDKYGAFMQGNPGYSSLEGDGEGSILVLKDSYANCFMPFLTANYETIDIIDYRFYGYGLDSLIAENEYSQILVLYNIDSFKSDGFFKRVSVRG
ncbi:MAG: DHHW family protein [Faecalibacterium sp.]